MTGDGLLLANLAATLFLTGLSWFLQVVHLPVFAKVDKLEFASYAALHRRRNTVLMSGPMLIELVTALWLALDTPPGFSHSNLFHAMLLLILIWLVTFLRHVPLHARLLQGDDESVMRDLVRWNLTRTLLWTARSALMLWIAATRLRI
jgi:hypothetical protein